MLYFEGRNIISGQATAITTTVLKKHSVTSKAFSKTLTTRDLSCLTWRAAQQLLVLQSGVANFTQDRKIDQYSTALPYTEAAFNISHNWNTASSMVSCLAFMYHSLQLTLKSTVTVFEG